MKYDELVKELRKRVEIFCLCGDANAQIAKLLKASADAIEELQGKENTECRES